MNRFGPMEVPFARRWVVGRQAYRGYYPTAMIKTSIDRREYEPPDIGDLIGLVVLCGFDENHYTKNTFYTGYPSECRRMLSNPAVAALLGAQLARLK